MKINRKKIYDKYGGLCAYTGLSLGEDWQTDHIIPCCMFDLTKEEEQRKCFHYTNYQPLWAVDNLSKNKYIK